MRNARAPNCYDEAPPLLHSCAYRYVSAFSLPFVTGGRNGQTVPVPQRLLQPHSPLSKPMSFVTSLLQLQSSVVLDQGGPNYPGCSEGRF